jgi:hypothetical protein
VQCHLATLVGSQLRMRMSECRDVGGWRGVGRLKGSGRTGHKSANFSALNLVR